MKRKPIFPYVYSSRISNCTVVLFDETDEYIYNTVENKGKLILTEIFPSVQKHHI